jgi:heptosyltransferase-1
MNLLVVRLGAMGDVIHTLPAVATLRRAFPNDRISWAIEPRWMELLQGNPHVDQVLAMDRSKLRWSYANLSADDFEIAIDFQGLLKSAAVVLLSGARRCYGFAAARERAAAIFYSCRVAATAAHVVDRNLELARGAGASEGVIEFPVPAGRPEGDLPDGPFVLASPLAGWKAKQWPLESYARLAADLDMPLVLNGPPDAENELRSVPGCRVHLSGLPGLIDATRRAAAVVGIDSGPMHLAAALRKRGVAIFGPTDPARNGPYGGSLEVVRHASAVTTYKRLPAIHPSMQAVTPETVLHALQNSRHSR